MTMSADTEKIKAAAVHEAGHAVVAVHLHFPLVSTRITVLVRGKRRTVDGVTQYKLKCERTVIAAWEEKRRLANEYIMCICAGEAAQALFKLDAFSSAHGDRRNIRQMQEQYRISDKQVAELRERAEGLVRLPYVRGTICDVANALMARLRQTCIQHSATEIQLTKKVHRATLSAKEVSRLYRLNRDCDGRMRFGLDRDKRR